MNAAGRIDLNVDAGESYGAWTLGDDAALLDVVTSVNVACGYHAGDPSTMMATVRAAASRGVAIGAHPSYPDLAGFGRRSMRMDPRDVETAMLYQIGALQAIARAEGAQVRHVKPHGALYNDAADDVALARAIVSAVARAGELRLYALAGSTLLEVAREAGVPVAAEAFCDRAYDARGRLRPRGDRGAVIDDPQTAAAQAVEIASSGRARADDGSHVGIAADTLCVHGDTPGSVAIARAVRAALERAGVRVAALE